MSKLVAISLKEAQAAFSLRADILAAQEPCLWPEADIVVVTKQTTGEPELHLSMQAESEVAAGTCWWGAVVRLLLADPMGTPGSDADSRTSGRLAGHGIDSRFVRRVATRFRSAAAMLFILAPDIAFDMVLNILKHCRMRCEVLTTALSRQDEEGLRHALRAA